MFELDAWPCQGGLTIVSLQYGRDVARAEMWLVQCQLQVQPSLACMVGFADGHLQGVGQLESCIVVVGQLVVVHPGCQHTSCSDTGKWQHMCMQHTA